MSEPNRCPQCGTELLEEVSPDGLCPACLLKLGLSGAIPRLPEDPPKPVPQPQPVPRRPRWRLQWAVISATALAVLVAVLALRPARPSQEHPLVRFTITAPGSGSGLALSPDGTKLAFTASDQNGKSLLWLHRMDSVESTQVGGTEGAAFPFWSPDSRDVGFFAQGKLKTVRASLGGPLTLCDAPNGRGASWNSDGSIVFGSASEWLKRVPAAGGVATVTNTSDASSFEAYPAFLPDGHHFLFSAIAHSTRDTAVFVGSLDSHERTLLIPSAERAIYSASQVLYLREGTIMAQPFDAVKLRLIGDARPIAEGNRPVFTASATGVLAYRNGDDPKTQLLWFDRTGKILGPVGEVGEWGGFALSPDGKTAAVARPNSEAGGSSLWLLDLARGTNMRLTFAPLHADSPVWSPDGSQIAFEVWEPGQASLYLTKASGGAPPELLWKSQGRVSVDSWSHDGRFLLFTVTDSKKSSLWSLPLDGNRKPMPIVDSVLNARQGYVSPDGRWLTYVSDETGRDEIYVRTFPAPGGKWVLSANGGSHPAWRGDGKELVFVDAEGKLMAVDIASDSSALRPGNALALFQFPGAASFAVTPDGKRFLAKMPASDPASAAIQVVLNWSSEQSK